MDRKKDKGTCGGGIRPLTRCFKQSNRPGLVIGLGGSGIEILRQIKKEAYFQIEKDEFGHYDRITFLGIDTDQDIFQYTFSPVYKQDPLEEDELFSIMFPVAALPEKIPEWLSKNIHVARDLSCGTRGIRQIGRYCLTVHIDQLYDRLESIIRACISRTGQSSMNVHIITGLAGGTGSGIYLDICYLLRSIFEKMRVENAIYGYCILPDLLLQKFNQGIDPARQNAMLANGYAALRELQYFMNLPWNGERFEENYSDRIHISCNKKPMDVVYLISAVRNGNVSMYEKVVKNVVDMIIDQLTAQQMIYHISSASLNPAASPFASFDVMKCELPLKEMTTYLVSAVLRKMERLPDRYPNAEEVDGLLDAIGLNQSNLFEMFACCMEEYKPQITGLRVPLSDEQILEAIGQYQKRLQMMEEPTEQYLHKLSEALMRISADIHKGPMFAAYFLDLKQQNPIYSGLEKLVYSTGDSLSHEKCNTDHIYRCWREYNSEPRNIFTGGRRKRTLEYEKLQEAYFESTCKCFILEKVLHFLESLIKQIVNKYSSLPNVMQELVGAANENLDDLEKIKMFQLEYPEKLDDLIDLKRDFEIIGAVFERYKAGLQESESVLEDMLHSLSLCYLPALEELCHEFDAVSFSKIQDQMKRMILEKPAIKSGEWSYRKLKVPCGFTNIQAVAAQMGNSIFISSCDREGGIWYYDITYGKQINSCEYFPAMKKAYYESVAAGLHLHESDVDWRSTLPDIE